APPRGSRPGARPDIPLLAERNTAPPSWSRRPPARASAPSSSWWRRNVVLEQRAQGKVEIGERLTTVEAIVPAKHAGREKRLGRPEGLGPGRHPPDQRRPGG